MLTKNHTTYSSASQCIFSFFLFLFKPKNTSVLHKWVVFDVTDTHMPLFYWILQQSSPYVIILMCILYCNFALSFVDYISQPKHTWAFVWFLCFPIIKFHLINMLQLRTQGSNSHPRLNKTFVVVNDLKILVLTLCWDGQLNLWDHLIHSNGPNCDLLKFYFETNNNISVSQPPLKVSIYPLTWSQFISALDCTLHFYKIGLMLNCSAWALIFCKRSNFFFFGRL